MAGEGDVEPGGREPGHGQQGADDRHQAVTKFLNSLRHHWAAAQHHGVHQCVDQRSFCLARTKSCADHRQQQTKARNQTNLGVLMSKKNTLGAGPV